ncbi:DUF2309 domain-containing protein [Paraconexibacter algicola]|uniref:Probable inorganic carbon transporter subunit DabA n=1 Tax=Paraconexibacter algicola TaxID=2133960 RepID=A0A2T4UH61_9ACTN|nr:DUF2309 domain-containing protein [Paraconexibacter algicola]PTL58586.1 DUF2309 domain-containing protein [Paraconexibacter algicola]
MSYTDTDRVRLRAQVSSAATALHAIWPLRTFIAVNPLGGLQHEPFEQAVARSRRLLGIDGHLPLTDYRAHHDRGRITSADLDAALHRRLPELGGLPDLELDGTTVPAVHALRADLLHGRDVPAPPVLPRGAGEWCDRLLGTDIAAAVDAEVAKWLTAFCDSGHAAWAMPGRERGLYAAWRALVPHDAALDRLGLRDVLAAPAVRAEDAVLAALTALHVPDAERRAELRGQLARLPGFTGHVKWCAEHPDQAPHPADLVELLAIRLSYEAPLVSAATAGLLPEGTAGLRALVEQDLAPHAAPAPVDPIGRHVRAARVARVLGAHAATEQELEACSAVLERLPAADRPWVWQDAFEWHYRDGLLAQLARAPDPDPAPSGRPDAQAVFCIDARSEGLRRHLGDRGAYETFGFAGFYQLVIRWRQLGSDHEARLCPAPVTPTKAITERPVTGTERDAARAMATAGHYDALDHAFHRARHGLASPFALAEASGWLAGPLAAARTAAPERVGRLRDRLARRTRVIAADPTVATPDEQEAAALVAETERQAIRAALGRPGLPEERCEDLRLQALRGEAPDLAARAGLTPHAHAQRLADAARLGFDRDEQVLWAEFALRSFGLVDRFAPVVLLTGHGSRTENNAYEAALDCGACGGQHGGPNARIAAALLNRLSVRVGLAERGIRIPDDTVVIAGHHDTATDRVEILDRHAIPAGHRDAVDRLQADLDRAGEALAAERARRLPGPDHPRRRARDWAQIRPEWGLARHGAFVIGPGDMVAGLDLQTRTFLHSYDWRADPDGTALETILTAPGLVVQWINAQYYFSAVDPDVLGAGDKALHNVVGDVGVLEGPGGDLRIGLPWQSVAVGDELYHEPLRALFVVQAPRARIDELIARNDLLQHYVDGGWIALAARESADDPFHQRTPGGPWVRWTPATPVLEEIA